mmetsp:Transcript_6533/g.16199  ORF Transcript_6533/g.16199 Transcript_6533/m.16199 type:complete len:120 (+) Transcript_6533:2574-2933(+)
MIVRAHECVMDGFQRFASGHLITLFSATAYAGAYDNAGAILVVTEEGHDDEDEGGDDGGRLVVMPKLIYPEPADDRLSGHSKGNEEENWLSMPGRPPTPPRARQRASSPLRPIRTKPRK